ncbi:hypothetical protein D9611_010661 [Ephemerocybe angulata]|uniref:Uncharacterized protein n=1 Tax=Ephemerocybe angulata TaxID=980116 RepID=A0A8H5BDE2_9AGAR|nr:hypothetical protein D9611_010661 [Tulosesus angulatus]
MWEVGAMPTGFNFAGQARNVQNRRPPMQQPNLVGLGGADYSSSVPLCSSAYATGAGGFTAPPATSPPEQSPPHAETGVIDELQAQLCDTQSKLAGQVDKIRALKVVLVEQESTEREVETLWEMIESRQRELEESKGVRG